MRHISGVRGMAGVEPDIKENMPLLRRLVLGDLASSFDSMKGCRCALHNDIIYNELDWPPFPGTPSLGPTETRIH